MSNTEDKKGSGPGSPPETRAYTTPAPVPSENGTTSSGHQTNRQPRQKLGSYMLLERLGSGGLGEVWKARDLRLNRVVALKFITASTHGSSTGKDLLHEARAASNLNHPNILTIFEVGTADQQTFLAMEFVEGMDLRSRLRQGPLDFPETFEIAEQVASGLAAAHRNGIVHRDLKPENIMLRVDGYVKVVDFGLAKVLPWGDLSDAETLSKTPTGDTGQIAGTLTYMSPEQARGLSITPASDIFSFGIVFHEMLTGTHPFSADTVMDTLQGILNKPPQPPLNSIPGLPDRLHEVSMKCLEKDAKQRYDSAVNLSADLKEIVLSISTGEVPPAIRHKPVWLRALGGVLIAGLLGAGGWSAFSSSGETVAGPAIQSIAVMPFRVPAENPNAQLLAEILPEELNTALSGTGLMVASQASVLQLAGTGDPRAAGTELGVDTVLTGTVRAFGPRYRISVELVNTRTGFQIWSGTITTDTPDVLGAMEEITQEILQEFQAAIKGAQ